MTKNQEKKQEEVAKVNEQELRQLTNQEETESGGIPVTVIPVTIAVSKAFCPTIKCTSKCR